MGLFVKDKKILLELDSNARQSNAQIAKKVGLSKQVVNYRINKLVKDGVVKGFRTIINAASLGYQYHDVFIKRKTFRKEREKDFIDYISKADHVSWFIESSGQYDYVLAIFSKNLIALNKHISELLSTFEDYIADYELFTIIEAFKLEYKYLSETNQKITAPVYAGKVEEKDSIAEFDDTDLRILELLDQDARISITEISKYAKTKPNVASYRIKKLKEKGVIQGFRTIVNTKKIGKEWHIILFKLNPITPKHIKELINFLRFHQNCVYIVEGLGNWQLMADFHVNNTGELDNILEQIRSNYGDLIKSYIPLRVPKVHKSIFFPRAIIKKRKY